MSVPIKAILMLKAPLPGFAKTRLAMEIGEEEAVVIYRKMVENQLAFLPDGWSAEVHFAPPDQIECMRDWLGDGVALIPQVSGNLGDRMQSIAETFFFNAAGREQALLFLGGDCPEADSDALSEVAELLETSDVVIGPATDGGYWCLGLKRYHRELFEEIPWSSGQTLDVTKSRLRAAGIRFSLARELEDVDDRQSLLRVEDRIRG